MRKPQRGLTVLETLIAAALFAVAIMSLFGIYPVSARAARQSQGHLMALNLAERQLELARAMAYDAIEDFTQDFDLDIENNGVRMQLTFQTRVAVTEIRDGLKQLVVEVEWSEPDVLTRTITMETYVARLSP